MDISRLYQIINDKRNISPLEQPELKAIVDKYPYFQAGIFAYLSCLYQFDSSKFKEELSRQSICVNDRKALFYYILREEYKLFFEKTGKKELKEDKTCILLNAFFEAEGFSEDDDKFFTHNILHIGLVSSDYFSYLKNTEKEIQGDEAGFGMPARFKHQDIIDSYIEKSDDGSLKLNITGGDESSQSQIPQNVRENELDDEMFFTETLSKIYIRQKKYDKAYKIIKHLSLNYPKKNIYFADQLSFLEKLIINSKQQKNIK